MKASFAQRLKELRTENDLSSRALGEKVGVSGSSIIRWENGQNVILAEVLERLAEYFGVTMGYLFGAEN